jgi:hypothetical protein
MGSDRPAIDFVIREKATRWRDLERLDEADIERQPHRFVGGRNSWIAQTYLRLRLHLEARGWNVRVSEGFRPGAIAMVHRDDANEFAVRAHESYLVVVRADRAPVTACDLSIVQNDLATASHERFIPLWPQPGLRPRELRRGARLERIAYHGRTGSMPPWFSSREFLCALERRRIAFDVKSDGWEDYRDVDLALAARQAVPAQLRHKPATKLYNAWLAGVPMLASPEPAYSELRRSAIDFVEVRGAGDVLAAIDLLRANPRLYAAMALNGVQRGRDYDVDAVRGRWLDLLVREVEPAFAAARSGLGSRRAWYLGAMAEQKIRSRIHRLRIGVERWNAKPRKPRRSLFEGPADDLAHVPR